MKIKIGIIGTGLISKRVLLPLRQTNLYEIIVIKSRTLKKAKDFANDNNIDNYIDDINDFKKYSLDAVYILSKTDSHYLEIIWLISNGINVICEKPLVTKLSQHKNILKAMKKTSKIVFHAHKTKYLNSYRDLIQYFSKSKINYGFVSFSKRSKRIDNYLNNIESYPEWEIRNLYFYPLSISLEVFSTSKFFYPVLDRTSIKQNFLIKDCDQPTSISFKIINKFNYNQYFYIYSSFENEKINLSFFNTDKNIISFKESQSLNGFNIYSKKYNLIKKFHTDLTDSEIFMPQFKFFYHLIFNNDFKTAYSLIKKDLIITKIIEQIDNFGK